jgi:hypothetical protein
MKDIKNLNSTFYKRSLVIGTLLGDASSRKRVLKSGKVKAEYFITHSLAQADLVEWKAQEFQRLYNKEIKVLYYANINRACFSLTQGRRLRVIHKWFHCDSVKTISDKIRFMDHPIGLAMLLCDDGSIGKRKKKHRDGTIYYLKPTVTIATHCFERESVDRLLNHIKILCGADGFINPERRLRNGELKVYNRVWFNTQNSRILWEYVKHWIPKVPSMMSKFSYIIESYGID